MTATELAVFDKQLLPCPFCGLQPHIVYWNVEPQHDSWYGTKEEVFVWCSCGCSLFDGEWHEGFGFAYERLVETWNKRVKGQP